MVSPMIRLGLVHTTSHPTCFQSLELKMDFVNNYVIKEKVVKSVIGDSPRPLT